MNKGAEVMRATLKEIENVKVYNYSNEVKTEAIISVNNEDYAIRYEFNELSEELCIGRMSQGLTKLIEAGKVLGTDIDIMFCYDHEEILSFYKKKKKKNNEEASERRRIRELEEHAKGKQIKAIVEPIVKTIDEDVKVECNSSEFIKLIKGGCHSFICFNGKSWVADGKYSKWLNGRRVKYGSVTRRKRFSNKDLLTEAIHILNRKIKQNEMINEADKLRESVKAMTEANLLEGWTANYEGTILTEDANEIEKTILHLKMDDDVVVVWKKVVSTVVETSVAVTEMI